MWRMMSLNWSKNNAFIILNIIAHGSKTENDGKIKLQSLVSQFSCGVAIVPKPNVAR